MITVFALIIFGLAAATVTALFRGLLAFHNEGDILKNGGAERDLLRGTEQNRMMAQRVFFQGLAILVVALLGAVSA